MARYTERMHATNTSQTREKGERCPALRKDGQPCRALAGASGYCVGHCPDAQQNRAKGGAGTSRGNRAAKLLPSRLRPVADLIEQALTEVYAGTLDARRASALAALAGVMVRIVISGELEERMRELERMWAEHAETEQRARKIGQHRQGGWQ